MSQVSRESIPKFVRRGLEQLQSEAAVIEERRKIEKADAKVLWPSDAEESSSAEIEESE